MYTYNDAVTYNPNAGNQMVPNMLTDAEQGVGNVRVQEGVSNMMGGAMPSADVKDAAAAGPQTVPVYAIDSSIQQFDIPDPIIRRNFARKVFLILTIQHIIMLPIIELFIISTNEPLPQSVRTSVGALLLFISIGMYFFSDIRRYAPMNVAAFVLITLLVAIEHGANATELQSHQAICPMIVATVQLLTLIAYSKQTRFKFTNVNAILMILLIGVISLCVMKIFLVDDYIVGISSASFFHVAYIVYDVQLMLSGHHGYRLQPEEHIFAVVNVYADVPNFVWRIFRYIFITPVVRAYQFFKSCCMAEVC